ncbi:MAG TPA: hypothetical protein VEK57_07565 [Thermoanaerobaculia bacterium]|nr:hypothetical protein [Thermoanaerobaculia bacterium]
MLDAKANVVEYFSVVDWLPDSADVAEGTLGQVQSLAVLSSDEMAVSVGWRSRDGRGRNALVVLRRVETTWTPVRFIRGLGALPSLVAVGDGLLAGTTFIRARATAEAGPPKVTLFNTNGCVLAELFRSPAGQPGSTGDSKLAAERGVIAFFDDVESNVMMFRAEHDRRCRETGFEADADFPPAAAAAGPHILAKFDLASGNPRAGLPSIVETMQVLSPTAVAVAANEMKSAEDVRTVVTVYDKDVPPEISWAGPFLQASYFAGRTLTGLGRGVEGSLFRRSVPIEVPAESTAGIDKENLR